MPTLSLRASVGPILGGAASSALGAALYATGSSEAGTVGIVLGAVAAFGLLSTSVVHSAPWSCDGTHCGETGQHSSYTFQLSTETEAYELNPSERTALDVQTPLYEQLFELIYEIPRKEGQPDA